MLRLAAARSRAIAAPLLRGQTRNLGAPVSADFDKNLGRTPERTAELERLAEEHNGFMFGEIVRAAHDGRPRLALRLDFSASAPPTRPSALSVFTLQPGEKREGEDWDHAPHDSAIYGVAFAYRCVCQPSEKNRVASPLAVSPIRRIL